MKRAIAFSLLILGLASFSAAQYRPEQRFEFNIFGGYGLTQVRGAATYQVNWSALILPSITEKTLIDSPSKNAPFFGAGFNYFFTPNFGIGLNAGYLKSDLTTTAAFTYNWTWSDGSTGSEALDWTSTGNSLTSIPLSLNLVGRIGNDRLQGFAEAGPTLYFNDATIDSSIGWGFTYLTFVSPFLFQNIDALQIPINGFDLKNGKTSWTGFGFNVGLGGTYMFSPSIGVSLEARYFFCPEREFDWEFVTGTYNGLFTSITGVDFTSDDAQAIFDGNQITTIKINPSSLQFLLGLKIKI